MILMKLTANSCGELKLCDQEAKSKHCKYIIFKLLLHYNAGFALKLQMKSVKNNAYYYYLSSCLAWAC